MADQVRASIENSNLSLSVRVASASQTFFEGKARSVSSLNTVGPFDILPKHENFICLIKKQITIFDPAGKKFEMPITTGLLEVSDDKVSIFIGI